MYSQHTEKQKQIKMRGKQIRIATLSALSATGVKHFGENIQDGIPDK